MTERTLQFEQIIQQAGRLYTLPVVAIKVLELTEEPTVDLPALKQCIENDPALTTLETSNLRRNSPGNRGSSTSG